MVDFDNAPGAEKAHRNPQAQGGGGSERELANVMARVTGFAKDEADNPVAAQVTLLDNRGQDTDKNLTVSYRGEIASRPSMSNAAGRLAGKVISLDGLVINDPATGEATARWFNKRPDAQAEGAKVFNMSAYDLDMADYAENGLQVEKEAPNLPWVAIREMPNNKTGTVWHQGVVLRPRAAEASESLQAMTEKLSAALDPSVTRESASPIAMVRVHSESLGRTEVVMGENIPRSRVYSSGEEAMRFSLMELERDEQGRVVYDDDRKPRLDSSGALNAAATRLRDLVKEDPEAVIEVVPGMSMNLTKNFEQEVVKKPDQYGVQSLHVNEDSYASPQAIFEMEVAPRHVAVRHFKGTHYMQDLVSVVAAEPGKQAERRADTIPSVNIPNPKPVVSNEAEEASTPAGSTEDEEEKEAEPPVPAGMGM